MNKFSKNTPDLPEFRAIVRGLIMRGIAPTPKEIVLAADGRYGKLGNNNSGATLTSGRYTAAKNDELLLAGWRPVMLGNVNYSWRPVHRAPDVSEGHKVVSSFRRGDLVRILMHSIREANDLEDKAYKIADYEGGWHTDRDDILVPDYTALCVEVGGGNGRSETVMCADDELALITPAHEFPLL
jgi:hypothetical protein